MALAAVADDEDLLALDQVQVGIAIVINTHGWFLFEWPYRPVKSGILQGGMRFRGVV
jgi:hypothetical protein